MERDFCLESLKRLNSVLKCLDGALRSTILQISNVIGQLTWWLLRCLYEVLPRDTFS